MIRLVLPNRGIEPAMSSSRSTYSTPSAMAVRSSISRVCSVPASGRRRPARRQVMITGRGPLGQQPLEVHLAVDVIQPQLDQLGALLDEVLVLGDHVPVAAAADADAEHAG